MPKIVNFANWCSYVILIVAVQFFLDTMFIVNVSKAGVMRFVVVVVVINVVVNSSRCCCQLTSLCYR